MTQILSAEELQALLDLVGDETARGAPSAAPGAPARRATPFDFRTASRLKPEHLAPLDAALRRAVRPLAQTLGRLVRLPATATPSPFEQARARDLREIVGAPSLLFTLDLGRGALPGVLCLDPGFAAILVDRMLGGSGTEAPARREPTRVVLALATRIASTLWEPLRVALHETMPLPFAIDRFETDIAQAMRAVAPAEPILHAELKLEATPIASAARLFFPLRTIASHLRGASSEPEAAAPVRVLDADAPLAALPLTGTAVLGEAHLPMRDLLELEPGDVLRLDRRATDLVEIRFAGSTKFLGKLGARDGRLAVKIAPTSIKR